MIGASFNTVGEEGIKLTQLTPVGYEDVGYFLQKSKCGVNGEFQIKILNGGGGTDVDEKTGRNKTWSYYREYTARAKSPAVPAWQNNGRWVQDDGEIEIKTENDVTFAPGDGLWFNVASDAFTPDPTTFEDVPANKYTLNNAGDALLESADVPLREGSRGIVAPLSAAVKLTDIEPIGYTDVGYFLQKSKCGVNGEFQIKILNGGGGTDVDETVTPHRNKTWSYYREYTARAKSPAVPAWQNNGRWVQDDGEIEITKDNDVTFEMGEGLWFNVASDAFTPDPTTFEDVPADKYTLRFPGIE